MRIRVEGSAGPGKRFVEAGSTRGSTEMLLRLLLDGGRLLDALFLVAAYLSVSRHFTQIVALAAETVVVAEIVG